MEKNLKVLRGLILAAVVSIPLIFCTGLEDTFDLPKITLVYLLVISFWTIWIVSGINRGQLKFKTSSLDVPILVFLGALGVATLFSMDINLSLFGKYKGYYFGFIPILAFAGLYWAAVQVMDEYFRKKIILLLIITGFFVATYGILQFYGLEIFSRMPNLSGKPPVSSLGNQLYFACYIMMVFFVVFMDVLSMKNRSLFYYFQIGVIFLLIFSLFLTLSRSAWVGLFGGLLFFIVKMRRHQQIRKMRRILIPSFLLITLVIVFWFPAQQRFISIFRKTNPSNTARIEGWKAGLQTFLERPVIGTGPSTFRYGFTKHKSIKYIRATGTGVIQADAHNDIIQFLATTGSVGLAAYLYLWYVLFTQGIKKIRKDNDFIGVGCFLSLLALFIQNQFNFSTVTTSATAAFLAGILFYNRQERVISLNISRFVRKTATLIIIILAIFLTLRVGQFIQAYLTYKKGLSFKENGDISTAIQLISAASQIAPRNGTYLNSLVQVYREVAKKIKDEELKYSYIKKTIELAKKNVDYHPYRSEYYHNCASVMVWGAQETIGIDNPKALYEEYSKAWAMYRRSIELDPNFVQSWVNLAKLAHLIGDVEKAKAICKKVLEIDSSNKEIGLILENLNKGCDGK